MFVFFAVLQFILLPDIFFCIAIYLIVVLIQNPQIKPIFFLYAFLPLSQHFLYDLVGEMVIFFAFYIEFDCHFYVKKRKGIPLIHVLSKLTKVENVKDMNGFDKQQFGKIKAFKGTHQA